MKIGIITYRKYEERVLINEHFIIDDLFNIILRDDDYVKFQIVDEKNNLLLSTNWNDKEKGATLLKVVIVKREQEILGTTYNAYNTPQFTYKTKITWTVDGGICKSKKEAQKYADKINLKARLLIETVIGRQNMENH